MATDSIQLQPAWLHAQCPREGRYVIGPLLGRGGMGDVHEAWDVVLCRTVALKVLKAIEPASLIRFMHEAQIHARVVHPNICRIYDVDNHEGTLRVAMQLVRGPNLEQVRSELSLMEVAAIMTLVAQAVHMVHRLNLVHRDLKPSNILLERSAEGEWVPYVCDFGLAVALDEPALTFTHGVIGTPAYMAPEQLHGKRDQISPATDVFALGGTLFFALTGRPPGIQGSRALEFGGAAIPRDLRSILAKCLEQAPERRYPTAGALAEDLLRFRQGVPIHTTERRDRLRLRLRQLRPLRPWLLVLAGVLLGSAGWALRLGALRAAARLDLARAQRVVLAAGELAMDLRQEQMLPIHDLRPTYARIRAVMESERRHAQELAPEWRGQVHFAQGLARYLVRDWPAARAELEQAWTEGYRDPQVATLLAWATLPALRSAEMAAAYAPAPAGAGAPAQDPLAVTAAKQEADAPPDAVMAYFSRDYQRGSAAARAAFQASPWHWEAAVLAATCDTELAHQELAAAAPGKARIRYQDAMAAGRAGLAVAPSDPSMHHAYLLAGRGLAALALEWGEPPGALLAELRAAADRALRLDPTDPELQDDWLALRFLQAALMERLGEDPEPVLAAARAFLDSWVKDPLPAPLRADRMLIYWLLAEREFRRGGDPDTALTEALKTSGHTPFLDRDYFWEVVNFKARVDAARGADPRPALDAALGDLQPGMADLPWTLKETLAASWLIRAEWESGHGLDASASLRKARAFAQGARDRNPESGSACALEGLALALELKASPGERKRLLPLVRERLGQALARSPRGPHQDRLKGMLAGLAG